MRRESPPACLTRGHARWLLAGLWLWVACPAGGADTARIDRFLRQTPVFLEDKSLAGLRALGALQQEITRNVSDPYDPIRIDEYRTLMFEGLTVYGLVVSRQDLWPIRVTVTTSNWEMPEHLNVGASVAQVEAVLGMPTGSTPAVLSYRGETESVNFSVRDGNITQIELIYYPD